MSKFLIKNKPHPFVGLDFLVHLIKFYQFILKMAGGDLLQAKKYAKKLAQIPSMSKIGNKLFNQLNKVS